MKPVLMKEWKLYFRSHARLEDYLMDLYLSNKERKDMAKRAIEREKVASIATILFDPNNVFILEQFCRWNLVQNLDLPSVSQKTMMSLLVAGDWINWVYISQSGSEVTEDGLFAARDFCKNFIIGVYSGEVVWRADVEGGSKPSDEELLSRNVIANYNCLFVRDRNCRMLLVDATSQASDKNLGSLRMGCHYVRNTNDFSKRNVEFVNDGSLRCVFPISCDTELLRYAEEKAHLDDSSAASEHEDETPTAQIADSEASEEEVKKPSATQGKQLGKSSATKKGVNKSAEKSAAENVDSMAAVKETIPNSSAKKRKKRVRQKKRKVVKLPKT